MSPANETALLKSLRYELRSSLVSSLTWAHRCAGRVAGMRFSHYGLKRLQADAGKRRIVAMISRTGVEHSITIEDVVHVIAGGLLTPHKQEEMDLIRRAAVLCEAAHVFGDRGDRTTAETVVTYHDFANKGSILWTRFVGQRKERLLPEIHRGSVEVPSELRSLYDWIDAEELVSEEPILRVASLNWGLSMLQPDLKYRMVIDAVVDHELRAGGIDAHGLLLLSENIYGPAVLRKGHDTRKLALVGGDLTRLFEDHATVVAYALEELHDKLRTFQDHEDRLPWLMVRPPDELDRQIFDIVERLGSVKCRQIHGELHDPPPLRTLQRRLMKLCQDGLLIKRGGRKDAYYQIAQHT